MDDSPSSKTAAPLEPKSSAIRARDKGYTVEGRTRLDGDPTILTSRMELDENLIPTTYEYSRGSKGTIRVKMDPKTSSELIIVENGKTSETNFHFPPAASIIDNNFFHHYLILLYRVKSAEQSLAIFVPAGYAGRTGESEVDRQAVLRARGRSREARSHCG